MLRNELVFLIAGNTRNVETLDIGEARLSVLINHIVHGALIVFLKDRYVYDVFLYILFIGYFGNVHRTAFGKYNHIVDITAITYILVLAQACTHKTFGFVYIEFGIAHHYFGRLDGIEYAHFGFPFAPLTISLFKAFEMGNRIVDKVCEVVFHFLDIGFNFEDIFISLIRVEAGDTNHWYLSEFSQIVIGNLTDQIFFERFKTLVQVLVQTFSVGVLLEVDIHLFSDENLFERGTVPLHFEFRKFNFELLFEQTYCAVGTATQHF